ncbi:MAG: rhodanese-like domain-containing protein [bacterium]
MTETAPQPLTPKQAWEMIQQDNRCLLIDIRSTMEFLFVGHPAGAIHLPWIDEPDWDINPEFVAEIRKLLLGGVLDDEEQHGAPVILICRSGKRSHQAGRALLEAGLSNIFHVDEGFEGERDENHHRSTVGGWRFRGLPWEQC